MVTALGGDVAERATQTGGPLTRAHLLVVKVGSSLLVTPEGDVRRDWLATLTADIAAARAQGQRIIVVTSGAVALGARRMGLAKGGRASLEDAQAAAAVGQIALAGVWSDLLAAHDVTAAQLLVTLDDLEDRRRYLNAAGTLARLLDLGVVPVVNENDSVATAEIRFGDNDRLAARVAHAAGADAVLLLSDVDGLFTTDPVRDPTARHIARVEVIDAAVGAMADTGSTSGMGSGGMTSKISAASIATRAGIDLVIASGRFDHPLSRAAQEDAGTHFVADTRAPARKAWLGGRLTIAGTVTVDAGAAGALLAHNSLLAAGIVAVDGSFARGDVIAVADASGRVIANGLSAYDADDVRAILGSRSDRHADLLGYAPRSSVIHRDHLVLL